MRFFFVLVTFSLVVVFTLSGEIMSWSVLGVKELNTLQSKFRYHLCLEN